MSDMKVVLEKVGWIDGKSVCGLSRSPFSLCALCFLHTVICFFFFLDFFFTSLMALRT